MVEPPAGSSHRLRPPFAHDNIGPDTSLRWWSGNVGKRSVTVDLDTAEGVNALGRLIASADVVISGSGPVGDARHPSLIWVAVTPFGLDSMRADQPVTDLTLLAGGVRSGTAATTTTPCRRFAAPASSRPTSPACIARSERWWPFAHRDQTGQGQLVDVSVNAACNVSSEQTTYHWLVNNETCVRQTGRHAYFTRSQPTQVRCADGAYATTGVLPANRPNSRTC